MTNDDMSLVIDNINLAYTVAWKYKLKLGDSIELEELQSICFLGLVKASKSFDTSKNIEFSTYAYTVMKNEIINFYNKNKSDTISLSTEIKDDLYLQDTLKDTTNIEEQAETNLKIQQLYKFISELSYTDQIIVNGYLQGLSTNQIALKLGLSSKQINFLYRKSINQLRARFYRYMGGEL